jgi:hypothetical protein
MLVVRGARAAETSKLDDGAGFIVTWAPPEQLASPVSLAVGLYLLSSGILKLVTPTSVSRLLLDIGISPGHAPGLARAAAIAELGMALGIAAGASWASAGALGLVALFTAVLVYAVREGSNAPCGCLGAVGSGRVGGGAVATNAMLAVAIIFAWGRAVPSHPTQIVTGIGLAALLLIVPEGVRTVVDLRAARLDLIAREE